MVFIILKNTPIIVLGINSIKFNTDFIFLGLPTPAPVVVATAETTPVIEAETIHIFVTTVHLIIIL